MIIFPPSQSENFDSVNSKHIFKVDLGKNLYQKQCFFFSPETKSPKKSSSGVPKKIGVVHINKVLSEVYGSGAAASQQETIPLQQKLVMCSLMLLLKQGKMKEVTVGKVN